MRGRKPRYESRSADFREKLVMWNQTLGSSRPSLRALARELSTSHQLLGYYLRSLVKWQINEYWRPTKEIYARAIAEGRPLTQWEEQQAEIHKRAAIHAVTGVMILDSIEQIKKESKHRPLNWYDVKALKIFAPNFPEARELLQKCLQGAPPKRKSFLAIVRETPRGDGEACIAWARRIWGECKKYGTKCPTVLSEEILRKYVQRSLKKSKNNLPVITPKETKSFGFEQCCLATPLNPDVGRDDAAA